MSETEVNIEQLECGLRAAFVNMPHFRTHSARLTIHAGSLHEDDKSYGSAHFLEHVTFQGTETLPNGDAIHDFEERNGLTHNAFTNQTFTSYYADGFDLEAVGTYVSQVALHPLLEDEALEKERMPIVDELRGYASNPSYYQNIAHAKALRGELFSRPIGGSIEDVKSLSPEELRSFYNRHYQLANALLIICSAESVGAQRDFAQTLVRVGRDSNTAVPTQTEVELEEFNPNKAKSSLQLVDLPEDAQSYVGIYYDVPEVDTVEEQIGYNVLGALMAKQAHNKLRRELALSYGAFAGVNRLFDLNYGRNKNWANFSASTNLNGVDAVNGLNALHNDVIRAELSEKAFESVVVRLKRELDLSLESGPAQVADMLRGILMTLPRHTVDLAEVVDYAEAISIDGLKELQRRVLDSSNPIVICTSPSEAVLETVGEWAENTIQ